MKRWLVSLSTSKDGRELVHVRVDMTVTADTKEEAERNAVSMANLELGIWPNLLGSKKMAWGDMDIIDIQEIDWRRTTE